jgi:hypothetical protein
MPKGVRGSGTARKSVLSPEEARQERERLQAQLHELEAHDARRYAVVGRVVMRLAESDNAFATQLRGILERGVTDRHERQALGLEETIKRGGGRGRRGRKAIGSQAGMQGPIFATTDDASPTGPAEKLP